MWPQSSEIYGTALRRQLACCVGNPFVTPETTRDVVITARLSAVNLFFVAIEQLMFELSNWRCSKEMQVGPKLRHL